MEKLSKTRVIFESFEYSLLSKTCSDLSNVINKSNETKTSGAFVFPKKKVFYCLLKSPHVYKKSREQFCLEKYRCLFDIYTPQNETSLTENFLKVKIPPGVSVRINYLNE